MRAAAGKACKKRMVVVRRNWRFVRWVILECNRPEQFFRNKQLTVERFMLPCNETSVRVSAHCFKCRGKCK